MKLVIFDLDGTLYRAQETTKMSTQKAFEELGLPIPSSETIVSLIGDTMEEYCTKLVPEFDKEQRKNLVGKIRFYEDKFVIEKGKLFDGVFEMLECLNARGYDLAICSNGSSRYINTVLNACMIQDKFNVIKGKDLSKSKSNLIKEILDELRPEEAFVVGDRLHDFEGAKNNDLISIGVSYGYGGNEAQLADYVANNPTELLGHVFRLSILNQIMSKIKEKHHDRPYIIGINGVDASGKTTFTSFFEKYLMTAGYKTQLVHLDDFHHEARIRKQGDNEINSYISYAFNLDLLINKILDPAKNRKMVDCRLNLLDLDSDSYINEKHYFIDNDTIVLVEGVLLFRKPINCYFDMRIFIDIGFDEVIKRAEIRDVPKYGPSFLNSYGVKYIPIQEKYLKEWNPKGNCDYIIDNTDFYRPVLTVM